jgi:hypothetical protein
MTVSVVNMQRGTKYRRDEGWDLAAHCVFKVR